GLGTVKEEGADSGECTGQTRSSHILDILSAGQGVEEWPAQERNAHGGGPEIPIIAAEEEAAYIQAQTVSVVEPVAAPQAHAGVGIIVEGAVVAKQDGGARLAQRAWHGRNERPGSQQRRQRLPANKPQQIFSRGVPAI